MPQALIETAVANVVVARSMRQKRNRLYWRSKADACDRWARTTIPSAYSMHMKPQTLD